MAPNLNDLNQPRALLAACDQYVAEATAKWEKEKDLPGEKRSREKPLRSCPKGYRPSGYKQTMAVPRFELDYYEQGVPTMMILQEQPGLTEKKRAALFKTFRRIPERERILLEPWHINALLFPGCFAKNAEYYENAKNAYRTSREHGGEGCWKDHLRKR